MVPGLLRRMFILYPLDRTFCMYLLNTIDLWSNLTPYSPCWVVLWMTYAKMREGLKSHPLLSHRKLMGLIYPFVFILNLFVVCVHSCICFCTHVQVYLDLCTYVCACQKTTLYIMSQEPATLFSFFETGFLIVLQFSA